MKLALEPDYVWAGKDMKKRTLNNIRSSFSVGVSTLVLAATPCFAGSVVTLEPEQLPGQPISNLPASNPNQNMRFGLTGEVSSRTALTLARGNRVPVIVMLGEPKLLERFDAGSPSAAQARASALELLRENVLAEALGVNGFERSDGTPHQLRFSQSHPLSRSVITREFEFVPGFGALLNANEIERLRVTTGVISVREDRLSETQLPDSTSQIGIPSLWNAGVQGAGGTIAVLDTGVETEHPMTRDAISASACFNRIVPNQSTSLCPGGVSEMTSLNSAVAGDSCIEDDLDPVNGIDGCFHGTHVAATAAGRTATSPEGTVSGVARLSSIIAVNVFAKFEASSCSDTSTPCVLSYASDQIAALEWLYANREALQLTAVNMSLGGGEFTAACDTDPLASIIGQLRAAGVVTVISSGNDGSSTAVSGPGCISQAITVGSTTLSDNISSFSNSTSQVDVLAPGSAIYSAWQSEKPAEGENCIAFETSTSPGPDGFCHWFRNASGTSMAAPHVAGAFSLLSSEFPNRPVAELENALESSGVPIFDSRNGLTFPRIQVDAAYQILANSSSGISVNDAFADRVTITGTNLTETENNLTASAEVGRPSHAGRSGGASLWWAWTPTSNSVVNINTVGSNFDTLLAVYAGGLNYGTGLNTLAEVASNDDITSGILQSEVTFRAWQGFTYYIAVDGFAGARGDIVLNIE